jgi:hypothetical protein
MQNEKRRNLFIRVVAAVFFLFSSGCIPLLATPEAQETETIASTDQFEQDVTFAETQFFLQIPQRVMEDLVIEIIDDVTGIELNPTRYVMDKISDLTFSVSIPLKVGSVVKYRYFRNGSLPIYETDANSEVVDYRAAYIKGANEFSDFVYNWTDKQSSITYGRIEGQILNSQNSSPLPNLLVIVGGVHTFTNSLGNFAIEQLPPGKQTITVLSTDGEYQIFQQEAVIGEGMSTQANIALAPAEFVNITFIVHAPSADPLSLRMLGNTYQLGNVFGETYNGDSAVASRSPILGLLPDGTYSVTLSLPVGFNLVYKYSLGNGFWNAELDSEGKFRLREVIIPDKDSLITDYVTTFQASDTSKIELNVAVPQNTPETDSVSIQFSPFGWSSPIPMAKLDNGEFTFTLFGPFNMVGNVNYRFCRNEACDTSVNLPLANSDENSLSFSPSQNDQVITNIITEWENWGQSSVQTEIVAPEIKARGEGFLVGFEQSPVYNVFVPIYSEEGYRSMKEVNANIVIIPFEWPLQSLNPVVFAPQAGENSLWKDILSQVTKAKSQGLEVLLSPKIKISNLAMNQLQNSTYQRGWEQKFTSLYSEFLIYAADLAQFSEIRGLVISTSTIDNSNLKGLSPVNDLLHSNLSAQLPLLKSHFSGDLFVELNPEETSLDSETLLLFDHILVDADWDISQNGADVEAYTNAFRERLQGQILEMHESTHLPITIMLDYPSAKGSDSGCVLIGEECMNFELANQLTNDQQIIAEKDLDLQKDIYTAALAAINETDWLSGVISKGYNVQVSVQDSKSSVRGKPADDLLWYWYPKLLGIK